MDGECDVSFAISERQRFDPAVRKRGADLARDGAVRIQKSNTTEVHSEVQSSSGYGSYDVEIVFSRDRVDIEHMFCNCPYAESQCSCKHIWATLLEMDARDKTTVAGASQPSSSGRSKTPGSKPRAQVTKAASEPPAWLKELNELKRGNALGDQDHFHDTIEDAHRPQSFWYVINVGSATGRDTITLDLKTQQLRSTGQPGTIKEFGLSEGSVERLAQSEHRTLMECLLEFHQMTLFGDPRYSFRFKWQLPVSSSVNMTAMMQSTLLPQIADTGRLCWRLSQDVPAEDFRFVTHDKDGIWEPVIDFAEHPDRKEWGVTGRLVRRPFSPENETGEKVRPMTDILHTNPSGLVLFPESLSTLRLTKNFAWVQLLRRRNELRIPFADQQQFISEVMKTPALREMPLPESFCPCRTDVACIPRLRMVRAESLSFDQRQRNVVVGHVDFLYDGIPCSPLDTSPLLRAEAALIRRDFATETSHLQTLNDLGAKDCQSPLDENSAAVELPGAEASNTLMELLKANWEVEAEGRQVRAPGHFHIGVKSDRDWFDLQGELDFNGVSASLPELLQAVQSGQRFFRLSDGSQGMLPAQWLEKHSGLLSLGAVQNEKIRFKPSQAMILDALLDAQENVTRDRDFKAYCKKLREFSGIQPKSPAKTFQGELRDYQKEGLSWLHFLSDFRLGGCLADDMGLGKTVQVLALLESRRTRRLKADEVRRPSLVVVPKSLIFNWINEATRFAPKLKVINHTGMLRHDNELAEADVIVTTYGTLRMDIVTIEKMHFDYIILDEAQAIKNSASQAAKVCRLLKSDHRLAMTGTPVENHLGELWSLFEFLNPGMLGASSAFQKLTSSKNEQERAASLEVLSRALRPFLLRRTKTQVLKDLPGKTEQILYCEMTGKQKQKYNELKAYYRQRLKSTIDNVGIKRAKIHVLEALLRLRQAACHLGLIDPSRVREESGKLEAVIEQLTQVTADGHKALVFSQFTSFLDIVRKKLDKQKIRYAYLDGSTNNRQAVVQQFQNDDTCQLFLISLKAGGHGLNLTSADYVFILDPWWNPAVEAQAVDRAHRIGQDRHVFAYRLITKDTVEERILELQKEKRSLADAVISADASLISSLTAEDLTLLLS